MKIFFLFFLFFSFSRSDSLFPFAKNLYLLLFQGWKLSAKALFWYRGADWNFKTKRIKLIRMSYFVNFIRNHQTVAKVTELWDFWRNLARIENFKILSTFAVPDGIYQNQISYIFIRLIFSLFFFYNILHATLFKKFWKKKYF